MPDFTGTLLAPRSTSAPSSPTRSQLWYDSSVDKLKWWNGTVWVDATGGGGGGSAVYEQPNDPGAVAVGSVWIDTDDAVPVGGGLSRVSALPSSPTDLQEIIFIASAANGVMWRLKYNAGSASPYKWEYVGGSDLRSNAFATVTIGGNSNSSTGGYFADADNPAITAPLAGEYRCEFGAYMYGVSGLGQFWLGVMVNGAQPPDDAETLYFQVQSDASGNFAGYYSRSAKVIVGTAGWIARLGAHRWGIASPTYARRYLTMQPIRVG